jgi:hypothetical protein
MPLTVANFLIIIRFASFGLGNSNFALTSSFYAHTTLLKKEKNDK